MFGGLLQSAGGHIPTGTMWGLVVALEVAQFPLLLDHRGRLSKLEARQEARKEVSQENE